MGIAIRDLSLAEAQPLQQLFRSAMRDLAGGVSIVTIGTGAGRATPRSPSAFRVAAASRARRVMRVRAGRGS